MNFAKYFICVMLIGMAVNRGIAQQVNSAPPTLPAPLPGPAEQIPQPKADPSPPAGLPLATVSKPGYSRFTA
jgi:hypothetical protein